MTEEGPPLDDGDEFFGSQEPEEPKTSKGLGCFYGGLAFVGALIGGSILSSLLVLALGDIGGVGAILGFIPLGLLIAAGVYWRKVPGFLLGIGLTIGISLTLVTACVAFVVTSFL
jgi:hypothetical protein